MGNKRSFGAHDIPSILIKNCIRELTPILTRLVNQSFDEGYFPDLLKLTKIKPIPKKGGNEKDPSSYRPIALLPTISKIFEKCMANRVYSFLEKNNILDGNQYGFRKKCSTTLALYKYVQEIYDYLNERKYAIGIFLDMTKAYDKVSHKILLERLYDFGIRGPAHDWFRTYLSNRKQYTQIEYLNKTIGELENIKSDIITVNTSIPQGSVIGCLLFLLYINNLPNAINAKCILFADDVSLLFKSSQKIDYNYVIDTLKNTKQWLSDNNLEINLKKTKIMQFRTRQRSPLDLSNLSNILGIEECNEFKLLGLVLDTHLNWKGYMETLRTKLARFTYALSILKRNTDYHTALSAYYANAYAWFNYSIVLWGDSVEFSDIFIKQKKLIRILANIKQRQSCRPHFKTLKILTLPSIYIMQMTLFVKKYRHFFKSKSEQFTNYNRRNRDKLVLPPSTLKQFSNGPYSRLINIYNKIPTSIKEIIKDSAFRCKLKEYLIHKSYYSVDEFLNDKSG